MHSPSICHCLFWKVQIDICSGTGRSVQMARTSVMSVVEKGEHKQRKGIPMGSSLGLYT